MVFLDEDLEVKVQADVVSLLHVVSDAGLQVCSGLEKRSMLALSEFSSCSSFRANISFRVDYMDSFAKQKM